MSSPYVVNQSSNHCYCSSDRPEIGIDHGYLIVSASALLYFTGMLMSFRSPTLAPGAPGVEFLLTFIALRHLAVV